MSKGKKGLPMQLYQACGKWQSDLAMDKEVNAYRYRFQFQFAGNSILSVSLLKSVCVCHPFSLSAMMRSTSKKVIDVI